MVRDVHEILPDHVRLRLDANQAWSYQQAVAFAEAVTTVDVEYVEEPLRDPTDLESLHAQTGLPFALDESLLDLDSLDRFPSAAALVCKPTILGGIEMVERLVATGKKVVFSAAFESGVGIARIVQLAATYAAETPAGLDTIDWLVDDLLVDSPVRSDGMFTVLGDPQVNVERLERIEL